MRYISHPTFRLIRLLLVSICQLHVGYVRCSVRWGANIPPAVSVHCKKTNRQQNYKGIFAA